LKNTELKAFARAQKDGLDIFADRHRKYGAGNIGRFGLLGIVVRLSDKLERLINSGDNDTFDDETLEDTLIDIANYATIGVVVHRGEWGNG
jgi:ASC-1-like (ASCH) protein